MGELLYRIIDRLADAFTIAIIVRAILSWFPIAPYNPFVVFLFRITEPILGPLRRYIPRLGMLDLTPLVAIVILQWVVPLLARLILL